METIIGIDLGTTNSVAAWMSPRGPELIPNAVGSNLTPSVVAIDEDGKLLVGAAAKEWQVLQPDRCAALFKRKMGTETTVTLQGKKFSPEELSSLVLRSLKSDAEAMFGAPVNRAVITVPAYFNDRQRKATIAAGKIAGLNVERILNEPTSAAIAYGFHEAKEEKTFLIFDLGGGTFDVSIVELFDGALEVRASSGESVLGGEDFTRTLAARILEGRGISFERAEADSPLMISRILQLAEVAKCRLSTQESVTIRIPDKRGEFTENSHETTVNRAQLEQWIAHILARIELPIRRVLGDSKLNRDDIDEVILVGGATRMPLVVDRITQLLGKVPHRRLNPDEVVAMGAAVQAGLVARSESVNDLVVTDVAPFTLGIAISKQFGHELRDGYFLPVIERNTTIPISRAERVSTINANQTSISIRIYQGESRRIEDNLYLGEFEVSGIPRGPSGQAVDVRLTYDLNGVLEVEATVVATGKKVNHIVTKNAKGLSAAQIQEAIRLMEKLKTHPREETANRFLLRRAERVYQELPTDLRFQLSQLLDGFEGAMEIQDAEAIDRHRANLELFLSAYDPEMNKPFHDEDHKKEEDDDPDNRLEPGNA